MGQPESSMLRDAAVPNTLSNDVLPNTLSGMLPINGGALPGKASAPTWTQPITKAAPGALVPNFLRSRTPGAALPGVPARARRGSRRGSSPGG